MTPERFASSLSGVLAFFPTPFTTAGEVDHTSLRTHISRLPSEHLGAVVVAGGVGEFYALAIEEHLELIGSAAAVDLDIPLIVGTAADTRGSVRIAARAAEVGAAGLMVNPLAFVDSSPEQLVRHYRAIADAGGLGLIAFSTAAGRLPPDVLEDLCDQVPSVVAFKDEVGDLRAFLAARRALGGRLRWINGMAEPMARVYAAAGADATTSGIANAVPKVASALWRAAQVGDKGQLDRLEAGLTGLLELRSRVPGHQTAVLKAALDATHGDFPVAVRPPLRPLDEREREQLVAALDQAREALAGVTS